MATAGFLHTSRTHVPTFRALLRDLAPDVADLHVVAEDLLADARRLGPDAVRDRVAAVVAGLAATGADVVLCTCSTLGGLAEAAAGSPTATADGGPTATAAGSVPVVRVDRPMARAAVATGGRVGVVAALASTADPTRALLVEEAARAGTDVTLVEAPCPDAWEHFERGDVDAYLDAVEGHVADLVASGTVDRVVLAQASMAPVAGRIGSAVPVLASPATAVAHVVGLLPS